jgi:hypothetical protein
MKVTTLAFYKDELDRDRFRVFEVEDDGPENEITNEYDVAKAKLDDGRVAWIVAKKVGRG